MAAPDQRPPGGWRARVYDIVFGAEAPAGKGFDVALIVVILASVGVVMLDSVAEIRARHGALLRALEWGFTLLFTAEYLLRLVCVRRAARYARSFFGVVDLLAILPTYVSVIFPGAAYMTSVRVLRILRVFRVLKLAHHVREMEVLGRALKASRRKITVFLMTVFTLVVILGSIMHLVEGAEHGFTSIPRSVYWAIVTLTTVGYGDISPQTDLGQAIAAGVMIMGWGILAVPTGIVTVELTRATREGTRMVLCPGCSLATHDGDARYCKRCGVSLEGEAPARP